jgi:maltose alpha-D-glucosyltransferase/alpha-amylase
MQRYPQWYKDAIIYQLHVKAFCDSSGDGIGDFRGLTSRIDHIKDLGATAIWLLPFYTSPLRDDGYDISDYCDVNPSYGTIEDVREFIEAAHERDLYVITELVINHTSEQHPWFQRARRAPHGSEERDFYVWSETNERYAGTRIIFTDTESSNWTWDSIAGEYYWHRFFSHQPDLNFANPNVIRAVTDVMRFWLDMGVDGMRLDAVPYLCEREGTNNENLPETHAILKILRAVLDAEYENRVFLAEANQWPEDVAAYFGDGDECHMAFHFPLMPRLFMSIAEEDRYPIVDIMRQTPEIPPDSQWAIFLRNHDEMTLEMVTERERDYMYGVYATEPRARINVGIRRRLAPLMDNDRRKIELLTSLLMSMPGTPVVYYGDEIGMGDNIYLGDRDGVRTPMQWSVDRNGGFSRADPHRLYLPPIMDPIYGFQALNVEAQSRSSSSLINWMKRCIAVRKQHRVFGRGKLAFLTPSNRNIFAYLREDDEEIVLCVANLSRSPQPVALDLARLAGRTPVELLGRSPFPTITGERYVLTLAGHAFLWFELAEQAVVPTWQQSLPSVRPEYYTLVLPHGMSDLSLPRSIALLENNALPTFLPTRRWFRERTWASVSIASIEALPHGGSGAYVASIDVAEEPPAAPTRYLLPVLIYGTSHEDPPGVIGRAAIARTRTGPHEGLLYDAVANDDFVRGLVTASAARAGLPPLPVEAPVRRYEEEKRHSWAIVAETYILKAYRRHHPGVAAEVEMLRHFATLPHQTLVPDCIDVIEDTSGQPLATVQRYLYTQGDLWSSLNNYLSRFVERHRDMSTPANGADDASRHHIILERTRRLGVRVAEFHRVLAEPSTNPRFAPEPFTSGDVERWREEAWTARAAAWRKLSSLPSDLPKPVQEELGALMERGEEVDRRLSECLSAALAPVKTRIHGDLHLGAVLVCGHDFRFVDFEGDSYSKTFDRNAKDSPLRDIATLLISLDYAASAILLGVGSVAVPEKTDMVDLIYDWRTQTIDAFRQSYQQATEQSPALPGTAADRERLLEFFLMLRSLIDIAYEIDFRPSWLPIPTASLLRSLDRAQHFQATHKPMMSVTHV